MFVHNAKCDFMSVECVYLFITDLKSKYKTYCYRIAWLRQIIIHSNLFNLNSADVFNSLIIGFNKNKN